MGRRSRQRAASSASERVGVGTRISGYRVERILSARAGLQATVEASAPRGGRVALKVLDNPNGDDGDWRERVTGLAQLRGSIDHPNLLPLIRVGDFGPGLYLASPLTSGGTLAKRLRSGGLEVEEAMRVLGQVAGALETAAAHGLAHRELTPDSILVTQGEPTHAFLTDFGIALPATRGCEFTGSVRAADYLSPEAIHGEPLGPESNVYSLGCILVECLTGAPPYPYERPLLTQHAHLVEAPPRISQRRASLPASLDDVVAKALAKEPGDRFTSPARLIRAAAKAVGVEVPIDVISGPVKKTPARAPARARTPARRRAPAPAARSRKPAAAGPRARRPAPPPASRAGRPGSGHPARRGAVRRRRAVALGVGVALVASGLGGFASGRVNGSGAAAQSAAAPSSAQRAQQVRHVAYVRTVAAAVQRLDARRTADRQRLLSARRASDQAAAAQALVAAYQQARRSLPAGQSGAIQAGLSAAERAYGRLADAARSANASAWRAARREALQRELEFERALGTLQRS